ncbi:hypothetical protein [Lacimicrobium alkaliphilum]|uniref:Uncharacterized protein n=2 Tax=Lacimicrobium alkaliphilum TaxID=1526571 RepID=A0ABQ1R458_9ALTE|nr:hypothetical protein [Lacimicrobium alkaliphilum]GGD55777.1 hypothetical protein GCM10011357_09230 [Lacimicrobium alkaliphilum]
MPSQYARMLYINTVIDQLPDNSKKEELYRFSSAENCAQHQRTGMAGGADGLNMLQKKEEVFRV